jgi:hypothetical protein
MFTTSNEDVHVADFASMRRIPCVSQVENPLIDRLSRPAYPQSAVPPSIPPLRNLMKACLASLCCIALFTLTTFADDEEEAVELNVGDPAPSFVVQDDEGNEWNSDEHFAEGTTVVYFYPADFTRGCTRQAHG